MGSRRRERVNDPGDALRVLVEALGRSAIPYLIGVSMASGIHGIYRTSLDVDLVADIHAGQIPRFIQHLGSDFYADAGMMRDALESGRSFNLIHYASSYKFDIFPLSAPETTFPSGNGTMSAASSRCKGRASTRNICAIGQPT